jgi:hypothetical protein
MLLMQLDPQGGDHAEVAAAAAYCPEQVGLLIGTGRYSPPVREYHFGAKQAIYRQAVQAIESAIAATQGQAGEAASTAVAQCRE